MAILITLYQSTTGDIMKTKMALMGMLLMGSTSVNALDLGFGVKAGTAGFGGEVSVALTQTINARISLTSVDIDDFDETLTVGDDGAEGDIDAVMSFDFGANALLFDWYVFDGTFHVTGGFLKNNGKIDFSGQLVSGSIEIDGQPIDASDIDGDLGGSISAGESYEPYLGIGWGRKADDNPGLSLSVELGIALLDPKAELRATLDSGSTNFVDQDELNATLDQMEDDINSELSALEAFPILSVGLNYAF